MNKPSLILSMSEAVDAKPVVRLIANLDGAGNVVSFTFKAFASVPAAGKPDKKKERSTIKER